MANQRKEIKSIIKSWANVFIAAAITAFLVVIVDTGSLAFDLKTAEAIVIAGLVAVLPVIKNYLDSSDHRYGRGYEEE